jgi:hypothetical protein
MKPIIKKGLEYAVDTLGNKIGALPSSNVLFDAYNIASKNKMASKIKGVVEDMPNIMNLPYQIGQKLHSEGKLPLPIGTSLLPLGRKGYPDEVHKIIGHKGDIYNSDLYGYEIQAPNGDIFFQPISNPKLGLREQKADKVGSFTAALGPEGVAEMQFVPPSRSVRKSGALPSATKSLRDYSDIIEQGVMLDTADAYKNIFHSDTEFAKAYGGELKSGSLKYGSDDMPPSLTDKELVNAQNEIKGLTQDYLKDLPDNLIVYRYGDLDNETGVSSFTLNPNYNVDSNLPWQKRLQSTMQTFKVKKEDVLASPDINSFFGGGRGFDEQEVIISNDKVKVK